MRYLRLLIILLCLLPTACLNSLDLGPGLEKTSIKFRESMRWKDFPGAAQHLHPDVRKAFLTEFPLDEDLRIVDSLILAIRPDAVLEDQPKTAQVEYQFEYYRLPSTRVKKWHWLQDWELIPQEAPTPAIWMIRNPPPPRP